MADERPDPGQQASVGAPSAACSILTAVVAALAWDAPQAFGPEAGLTLCALLATSAGTLTLLAIGRPWRWSVAAGLVSMALVAAACVASAANVGLPLTYVDPGHDRTSRAMASDASFTLASS